MRILIELADESGLNTDQLIKYYSDGSANMVVKRIYIAILYGITTFYTLIMRANNGRKVILRGYQSYETLNVVIKQITERHLEYDADIYVSELNEL